MRKNKNQERKHTREYADFCRFKREGLWSRYQKIGMRCSNPSYNKPDQLLCTTKMVTSTHSCGISTPTPFVGRAITIMLICTNAGRRVLNGVSLWILSCVALLRPRTYDIPKKMRNFPRTLYILCGLPQVRIRRPHLYLHIFSLQEKTIDAVMCWDCCSRICLEAFFFSLSGKLSGTITL